MSAGIVLLATIAAAAGAPQPERLADGVAVALGSRRLEVRVCRDDLVRVVDGAPGPFFARQSLVTVPGACQPTTFEVQAGAAADRRDDEALTARIALPGGAVSFLDREGRVLLAEKTGGGRSIVPARVMDEATFHVQAEFEPAPGEALYGLGAHQNGLMNYAGRDVDMYQLNTVDVVPFLVSSRGYGVLWDNTSHTKFGDLREPVHVPAGNLYDAEGRPGGLTGTYRQGPCETGLVVGTRVDPQIAFGAPEDRPAISAIHNAPQVANPQLHPEARGGRGLRRVGRGGRARRDGRVRPDDVRQQRRAALARRPKLLVDTWRQGWLPWWDAVRLVTAGASATSCASSGIGTKARARCASSGRRRRGPRTPRSGPRSATASTTGSSTARTSTTSSLATAS